MEELINELEIFVNEKTVLSAQIRDIENKRNELAKERNTKKAQNMINNDDGIWSEINCLGRQISDLGNQSQWFQNQINSKALKIREQAFIEIDNLIAENVRKSRIISEQIEENRSNLELDEVYELTNSVNTISENIARIMFAKKLIKHNQFVETINLFASNNKEENEIVEQVEQIVENLMIEDVKKEEVKELKQNEEIKVEEFKPIEEIEINPSFEEYYNNIEEITEILKKHFLNEQEIITFEENNEPKIVEENFGDELISLKNIVVKIEENELVYKAELSNGEVVKIYPVKEKLLEKEKKERETWKRELIEYSANNYRNLRNTAIQKMDPIVCEMLDRCAVQYDMDSQSLVYNYVMSFSTIDEYDSDILPAITYNLSYINDAKITKKELRTLQKIVRNSNKNALVDIIGNVTIAEKIKCFMKKIFNVTNANILPEGNKE